MCFSMFGSSKPDTSAADEARRRETERAAKVTEAITGIDNSFAGFDDAFFNTRESAYTDYALPQLDDQFADAKSALALTLARSGQGQSSTAGKEFARLKKNYDLQFNSILDQSRNYGNQARTGVESARGDLIAQANATADPDLVSKNSARRLESLSVLPPFDPVANTFNNLITNVSNAAQAHRFSPGGARNTFVSDIFNTNSSRVIS